MSKITINDTEYDTENLSEDGKAKVASLQFLKIKMAKLRSEMAIYQTARNSYIESLKIELENQTPKNPDAG